MQYLFFSISLFLATALPLTSLADFPRYAIGPADNFDWEYYTTHNNLTLHSEQEARRHYQTIGRAQNLPYCQKFSIAILLNLHNLTLTDEFITKINYFMQINDQNDYYININVPISSYVMAFDKGIRIPLSPSECRSAALSRAPYHPHLINLENSKKLCMIYCYLKKNLNLPANKIEIMFSENRGADIGGFLLQLDHINKNGKKFDYVVKLHSKTKQMWREWLTSFLGMRVNTALRKKQGIYACKHTCDPRYENVRFLLDKLNLPQKTFHFCGGTMFIAPGKICDFFANYDLVKLFNELNPEDQFHKNPGAVEFDYERLFGYVCDYLGFETEFINLGCENRNS